MMMRTKTYTPSRRLNAFDIHKKQGFTLIEVMFSMVILAVVFAAIGTMNFSSITAYTSSRDTTEASLIAEKTISFIQAEAEQWVPTVGATAPAASFQGLYNSSGRSGLKPTSILKSISTAQNLTWVQLDKNLPISSTNDDATQYQGRFCVAARRVDLPATAPNASKLNVIRIQIVVYYPGPSQKSVASCQELVNNNLQTIAAGTYPGQQILEQLGTRTEFFSTIVTPTKTEIQ